MRYLFYFFLISVLMVSCKKDQNILFEMNYPVNDFAINAGLNPFEVHYFEIRNITSNADSLFSFHNVNKTSISSIQPKAARLSSIFASSDYNFIANIEIRIFENDPDNYNVLFYRDNVPLNTGKDLDLIPLGVDIQDYALKENFGLVIRMELRDITPEFIESRLNFSFSVQ